MRLAPIFDVGTLTRRRFFDLLTTHSCQYIDLLGRMGISTLSDARINPALMATHAARFAAALPVPYGGPLVFLHDDNFVDDTYLRTFARSLPCSIRGGWQLYRPHAGATQQRDQGRYEGDESNDINSATSILRDTVFISHATPEDNSFVAWLSSKLSAVGYDVWCDIGNLTGGDPFWKDIESIIRYRAAKVLFIQSKHVRNKPGARKEVYLALKVGERHRSPRFVIPLRIDGTPFDETLIELIDVQAIDCRSDWLAGFRSLLLLLQRDGVPRSPSFNADQLSKLALKTGHSAYQIVQNQEFLISNLLPVLSLPREVNFFSCSTFQSHQLPQLAASLPIPAYAFYTHIVTTASHEKFVAALRSLGFGEVQVGTRASISWLDFLAARTGDLPAWKRSDARSNAVRMLNKAWAIYMADRGALPGELANSRPFWFFSERQLQANKIQFTNYAGRSVRRQLVGYSAKRNVYWHFGVQSRCVFFGEQTFFVLIPHVTFSSDGRNLLASKAQLHTLRRSFCRNWWNGRWRDLMQGFVAAIAGADSTLNLDVGADAGIGVAACFAEFKSSYALIDNSTQGTPSSFDDAIEDVWEDNPDDEELLADGLNEIDSEPTARDRD